MRPPIDPLSPPDGQITEAWHAQILANANALIAAGHLTPEAWAKALGAALAEAAARGLPDTEDTYFRAALTALEAAAPLSPEDLACRKTAWAEAYARTPHGQPVRLRP